MNSPVLNEMAFERTSSFLSSYPGASPQLIARTQQLWSAKGLDLECVWLQTIGSLRGFRVFDTPRTDVSSAPMDAFLLFDQAVIWVASLHSASNCVEALPETQLDQAQWSSLQAVTYRLLEQLDAIRLLFLTDLPIPSMQIARSISEDADMALAFLIRRKLARRFIACGSTEEANEFWRRHIAGGRAFRVVADKLYEVGLDYGAQGDYSDWRRNTLAILGTAAHTSFRRRPISKSVAPGDVQFNETRDCLEFVTLRLHEICAYSSVLQGRLLQDLDAIRTERSLQHDKYVLAASAAAIGEITIEHWRRTVAEESSG
ncbi:MAG: hypothetical protein K5905_14260 [Roseibium sp.]|uniref:hypothetical protein n=1 Tax=Roseibium sp. TaxID=1936156 RepID=UPI00260E5CD9|nr:hypothetical protein [Roseibium sp.]MCV0426628.1 hypothetical protein [Roseibium sp.]